ncbi:MAG: hypothetical protein O2866_05425 [archaeon]|nr:hypothetical protein [archaeon]MDA0842809.1 hypothetical protein [archaeon]MDA1168306.1 hypothetical protein [archaeon]
MNRQSKGYNLIDATLWAAQDRSNLYGLDALCQRARHAQFGHGSHNHTPTDPSDGGRGDPATGQAS